MPASLKVKEEVFGGDRDVDPEELKKIRHRSAQKRYKQRQKELKQNLLNNLKQAEQRVSQLETNLRSKDTENQHLKKQLEAKDSQLEKLLQQIKVLKNKNSSASTIQPKPETSESLSKRSPDGGEGKYEEEVSPSEKNESEPSSGSTEIKPIFMNLDKVEGIFPNERTDLTDDSFLDDLFCDLDLQLNPQTQPQVKENKELKNKMPLTVRDAFDFLNPNPRRLSLSSNFEMGLTKRKLEDEVTSELSTEDPIINVSDSDFQDFNSPFKQRQNSSPSSSTSTSSADNFDFEELYRGTSSSSTKGSLFDLDSVTSRAREFLLDRNVQNIAKRVKRIGAGKDELKVSFALDNRESGLGLSNFVYLLSLRMKTYLHFE